MNHAPFDRSPAVRTATFMPLPPLTGSRSTSTTAGSLHSLHSNVVRPEPSNRGMGFRLLRILCRAFVFARRKRLAPTLVTIALLVPALLSAGTISGGVKAQGKQGADDPASGGKYASRQFKFAEHVNYDEMHDFIVFIEGPVGTNSAARDRPTQVITTKPSSVTQRGAMFEPHVLPVMRGTEVEWPNHDDIYHNVFSFSESRPFDLGLYKKDDPIEKIKFDKPGRVDVFCSIHSRMNCIVLVLENPFFASTDKRGHYVIPNVPPGTYKLKAWHERLPSLVKDVTVFATSETNVDFTLGILNLPSP